MEETHVDNIFELSTSRGITVSSSCIQQCNQGKRRKLNVANWKDVQRKKLKDSGKIYSNRKGDLVKAGDKPTSDFDCLCPKACCKVITIQERENLFMEYYKLSYNEQSLFLMKFIDIREPVRRMKKCKTEATSRKLATFKYNINGTSVCKKVLLNTFFISQKRIQTLQNNLKDNITVPHDKRGMHHNRPHSKENFKTVITQHVNSFPRQPSHYSRHKSEKLYLSSDLSLAKMYRAFCEKYPNSKVSRTAYQNVFRESNLRIGVPRSDTCKQCDLLYNQLLASQNNKERNKIEVQSMLHHFKADQAYKSLKQDEEIAKTDPNYIVLCIDLQQVLFCPTLTHSSMYYQRQLASYNCAINDIGKNSVTFFWWNETIAKRGSAEIASCILKYFDSYWENRGNSEKKLIFWSDRCVGQNNNKRVLALYKYFVTCGIFSEVHQKFLSSGHSFLPCDRDFALIEKQKRLSKVSVPSQWKYVIGNSFQNRKFYIVEMEQNDFKNFEIIESALIKNIQDFKITQYMWIKMTKDDPLGVSVRKSHKIMLPFEMHYIMNRTVVAKNLRIHPRDLPQLYSDIIPLKKEKKKDLMNMIKYLEKHYQKFYLELPSL